MMHEETEKEFDKWKSKYPTKTIGHHHYIRERNIKKFISKHFTDNKILEEEIEGMKRKHYNETVTPRPKIDKQDEEIKIIDGKRYKLIEE